MCPSFTYKDFKPLVTSPICLLIPSPHVIPTMEFFLFLIHFTTIKEPKTIKLNLFLQPTKHPKNILNKCIWVYFTLHVNCTWILKTHSKTTTILVLFDPSHFFYWHLILLLELIIKSFHWAPSFTAVSKWEHGFISNLFQTKSRPASGVQSAPEGLAGASAIKP